MLPFVLLLQLEKMKGPWFGIIVAICAIVMLLQFVEGWRGGFMYSGLKASHKVYRERRPMLFWLLVIVDIGVVIALIGLTIFAFLP